MKTEGNLIQEFLKNYPTPLDTRLNIINQIAFINLITELGYREDKYWTPEEDEILNKLCKLANKHTLDILREIEEYNNNKKTDKDIGGGFQNSGVWETDGLSGFRG
jgi:hypothetical protein